MFLVDVRWNVDALLSAYVEKYKNSKQKKWSRVIDAYTPHHTGPLLTTECVRLKIRTLKKQYDRLVSHNNTSGNDPKTIPETFEDAFGTELQILQNTLVESATALGTKNEYTQFFL